MKKLSVALLLSTMLLGGFFAVNEPVNNQDKLAYDPGDGPIGGASVDKHELAYDPGDGPIGGASISLES